MSDSFERYFEGIDRPRQLTPQLRSLLEETIADPSGTGASEVLQGIDRPRALPTLLRGRLQKALTSSRHPAMPRLLVSAVAAVAALALITGSVVWNSSRTQPLDSSPFSIEPQDPPLLDEEIQPRTEPEALPAGSLVRFDSERAFLSYAKREALRLVSPHGWPGEDPALVSRMEAAGTSDAPTGNEQAAAAPPPSTYSTTNVQEEGVDETDRIKSDGKYLVTVARGRLWVFELQNDIPRFQGSVGLGYDTTPQSQGALLLSGDRAIHISPAFEPEGMGAITFVQVISIAQPSRPEVIATLKFEGNQVGARMVGGRIRLVIKTANLGPEMSSPQDPSPEAQNASLERNRQSISNSKLGDWLPDYVLERPGHDAVRTKLSSWSESYRPPDPGSGVSMLTVITIDPSDPRPENAVSVVGSGDIVYASHRNLYVTTSRSQELQADQIQTVPQGFVTRIHKFDISDPSTSRYAASGDVPGVLLNQFSMSEQGDHLRLASTMGLPWQLAEGTSESYVTVLEERTQRLVRIGSVGNLGRGERIFAVRFIGSMGYVVTFRQVDPLYVVDLRNPQRPITRGELKVPGFSSYLHPITDTLLLGIGRHADEEGRAGGLQLSLFDVSDPANPRRIHDRVMGSHGHSRVDEDHHAFLFWPQRNLVVIPAMLWGENGEGVEFMGALGFTVSGDGGFGEPVKLSHSGRNEGEVTSIDRSMVMGGSLVTFSEEGVLTSDLDSFSDRDWFAYPR